MDSIRDLAIKAAIITAIPRIGDKYRCLIDGLSYTITRIVWTHKHSSLISYDSNDGYVHCSELKVFEAWIREGTIVRIQDG